MPLKLVTLFGSCAKGRATASSDIDLLVVYKGRGLRDAFNIVSKTLGIRGVEPHVFTVEEFAAFIKQSPRTRKEWVEEAIVLYPYNEPSKINQGGRSLECWGETLPT